MVVDYLVCLVCLVLCKVDMVCLADSRDCWENKVLDSVVAHKLVFALKVVHKEESMDLV